MKEKSRCKVIKPFEVRDIYGELHFFDTDMEGTYYHAYERVELDDGSHEMFRLEDCRDHIKILNEDTMKEVEMIDLAKQLGRMEVINKMINFMLNSPEVTLKEIYFFIKSL